MIEASTTSIALESLLSDEQKSPINSVNYENRRPDNAIPPSLITDAREKIPIPSSFASSTSTDVSKDGNSQGKSGRMDDATTFPFHASKKSKLTFLSSESRPLTVEDRVRARAFHQQSAIPPLSVTKYVHSSYPVQAADPDIVLRIADGIWSHVTTVRTQRVFNASTNLLSNHSKILSEKRCLSKVQAFVLKDVVHVLRTTTMSFVGCTGKVMKSNGDVKSKLSKRQIVEAILELATPDRYSNWIVLNSSVQTYSIDGFAANKSNGPMLLQDMSPNTMIQINHSIPYAAVRKQILKTLV
jgi:hypothetical protein